MIDVEGMIRQSSIRVSVDQLVRNGKRYIHLLSRERIDELINRSVQTIVDKHRVSAERRDAASTAAIQAEARAEFEELLEHFQRTAAATDAVERSRTTLEDEPLEVRVEPAPPDPLDPVESFVRDLERQGARLFGKRELVLGRPASAEAVAELKQVEDLLRPLVARLVRGERDRGADSPGDPRELATLRKRLDKLQAYVATLEAALKTLSTAKAFSSQRVQNLLRDLGLAPEDAQFEKKKDMLKIVLQTNRKIRRQARELAARGVTLDAPVEEAVFSPVEDRTEGLFSRSSA